MGKEPEPTGRQETTLLKDLAAISAPYLELKQQLPTAEASLFRLLDTAAKWRNANFIDRVKHEAKMERLHKRGEYQFRGYQGTIAGKKTILGVTADLDFPLFRADDNFLVRQIEVDGEKRRLVGEILFSWTQLEVSNYQKNAYVGCNVGERLLGIDNPRDFLNAFGFFGWGSHSEQILRLGHVLERREASDYEDRVVIRLASDPASRVDPLAKGHEIMGFLTSGAFKFKSRPAKK